MPTKLRSLVALFAVAFVAQAAEPARDDSLPPGAIMRLGSTNWRQGGYVLHMMFSADGKRLYSWHERGATEGLTEWDVATGRALRRVELPGLRVRHWQRLPDGRGIAVVVADNGPYVWEFTDEKSRPPYTPKKFGDGPMAVPAPPQNREDPVCFAVAPDGKRLYGGMAARATGQERPIRRWDLTTQRYLTDLPVEERLAMQPDNCQGLFITPDGRTVVGLSPTKVEKGKWSEVTFVVRDAKTGEQRARFRTPKPLSQGLRWSAVISDHHIALGFDDATLIVRDLGGDSERRIETGHKKDRSSGVSAVAFTPDGRQFITAGRDGAIRIWDTDTGKEIRTIANALSGWIEVLAVSPDGRRVACAGQAGAIRHWDITTGAELGAPAGPSAAVTGVGLCRDGTAVTASADGIARVWDLKNGAVQRQWPMTDSPSPRPWLVLAPDGRTAVMGDGQKLHFRDVATGKPVPPPELPADLRSYYAAFALDGRTILASRTDGVELLDWPSGKLRRAFTLTAPRKEPGRLSFMGGSLSPDGRWLVLASQYDWRSPQGGPEAVDREASLDLWDAATGQHLQRWVDGSGDIRSVQFTPTGDLIFVGSAVLHPTGGPDVKIMLMQIHLINPLTGRLRCVFEKPAPAPGAGFWGPGVIVFSPDGRTTYCSGQDGAIHVYETITGKIRRSFPGHRGYVAAMACSADGRRLLSGSSDLSAILWDVSIASAAPPADASLTPDSLWSELQKEDTTLAFAAMARLAANPNVAIALIHANLKPATTPGANEVILDRLVAALDHEAQAEREKATRELDALGETAVAGLTQRLAKVTSPEVRQRIAKLLAKYDPVAPTPERLREERALELLEQINTPASRAVLSDLAKGAAGARLTLNAAASLRRAESNKAKP